MPQIFALNTIFYKSKSQKQGSLEKWLILRLEQAKHKMNQEQLVLPESPKKMHNE